MSSSLLSPRRRPAMLGRVVAVGTASETKILQTSDARILSMVRSSFTERTTNLESLRAVHALIARAVRPVYAMNDAQSTSTTLDKGRGSCSQRMAVLEAVARAAGIATRVQGLVIDGSFWYRRFPRLTWLVPSEVILAWPEFLLSGEWLSLTELFGSMCATDAAPFLNGPGETLFEALAESRISWSGGTGCDLSAYVRRELGTFESRDELFDTFGQTLSPWALRLADPLMSRCSSFAIPA